MFRKSFLAVSSISITGLLTTGCGGAGGAMTAGKMMFNMKKTDTHLRIMLDGHMAEQNKLKKAATGHSDWKIKETVSTTPSLRFQIEKPEKFGRITMVDVNIYQEFKNDYSTQAEYTIVSNSQTPDSQMQPNMDYNLGSPPAGFRVVGLSSQSASGVQLKPGTKYKLLLSVIGDHSETAAIEFKTR